MLLVWAPFFAERLGFFSVDVAFLHVQLACISMVFLIVSYSLSEASDW